MLKSKQFQKKLVDEYKKRYPLKEDALMTPFVIEICSKMIALAFELYEKESSN